MPHRWSRREVVQGAGAVGLGLLAGCGRWPGQASPARLPRIGILSSTQGPTAAALVALQEGLREVGYIEGQTLAIEWRKSAEPDFGDLEALAAELVGLQVSLILAVATPAALAAKRVTSTIPIVFTSVSDPIGSGLATSLARPGSNATGLSDFGATLSGKRLELLRDAVPGTSRVGMVWLSRNPANALLWRESNAVATSLGVRLIPLELGGEDALEDTFEAAVQERVDSLIVLSSPAIAARAAVLAFERRLPTMLEQASAVPEGGLLAYGVNLPDLYRRAATYVDKILKGTKPADLPIEQPMRFDFVINLRTAQALGLTIPHHIVLQATELIQ